VKRPVLVSGVLLIALLGVAGGYLAGDRFEPGQPVATGEAAPLGEATPGEPLPRKTPVPSDLEPLLASDLDFRTQTFTVHEDSSVRLSVRVPDGWQKSVNKKSPGEVKFLDSLRERGVRVESGFKVELTTAQQRENLIRQLESSIPYEDYFKILAQSDDEITGTDGQSRVISTLIYTYIPNESTRYVMVRWVATGGDSLADVEMSITGLPQDAKALNVIADQAAKSVTPED
jgi:hypothetical protein